MPDPYRLQYTGEEVDSALEKSMIDIDLSMSEGTIDGDNTTIQGNVDGAIVADVTNYYLNKTHVLAKKFPAFTNSAEVAALGIQNGNGDVLIPYANGNQMVPNGNPLGAILCMASFLNRDIIYGNGNSIFDIDSGDYNTMVCSDYVSAGLLAVSYWNSKAKNGSTSNSGENYELPYKCRNMYKLTSRLAPNNKEVYITREMAYIFAANDALFELEVGHLSNLTAGDILFWASTSTNAGVTTNYLNIHHCAMVVDVDHENGYVYVLECGTGTRSLLDYCITRDADAHEKDPDTGNDKQYGTPESNNPAPWDCPTFDVLRIFPQIMAQLPTRKFYVGRPSWPCINPVMVKSQTITGNTFTTQNSGDAGTDYNVGTMFELDRDDWGFKQGDVMIMHLHSNMNILNPNNIESPNNDVYIRILERLDELDPTTSHFKVKTAWRHITRGYKRHVQNDRVIIFPIDRADVNKLRVQMRSTNSGKQITSSCTFELYRL